jgi:ribonuclease HII
MGVTGVAAIDETDANYIIGSDECGYGSWAGPLVVCAALIGREWPLANEVFDSKALTEKRREAICKKIIPTLLFAIVEVPSTEIDQRGVYACLLAAHEQAIREVQAKHDALGCIGKRLVVVDGNLRIPGAISLPRADSLVPAVSAASIIGKVKHDKMMAKQAALFPGYDFTSNKGYRSPAHEAGLQKLGPCPIHRRSYSPIAALLEKNDETREAWTQLEEE